MDIGVTLQKIDYKIHHINIINSGSGIEMDLFRLPINPKRVKFSVVCLKKYM